LLLIINRRGDERRREEKRGEERRGEESRDEKRRDQFFNIIARKISDETIAGSIPPPVLIRVVDVDDVVGLNGEVGFLIRFVVV
jgi:hypothetical protein